MAITETTFPLTVRAIERLTPDSVAVTFDVPAADAEKFHFHPGQHVALHVPIAGAVERRTYSIAAPTGGPLRVAIRAIEGGKVSNWAARDLKPGAVIKTAPPQGRFVLPVSDGQARHVLFIAAGAGITPILGMMTDLMERERDSTATLLFGNRTNETTMFLTALEDLKDRYPARFDVLHVQSRSGDGDNPVAEGRLTGEKLRELATRRVDIARMTHAYLCGPGSMIKEARTTLYDLGMPVDRVFHEFFVSGGAAPKSTGRDPAANIAHGASAAVAILDGVRHSFTIAPGQSVLDAALKAGVKAPYSCTGGMCCTCRAKLVEGTAPMDVNYSLEDWEIDKGFVLTCQAKATSARVVVDYDAM